MKSHTFLFWLINTAILLSACTNEDFSGRSYPRLNTLEVSEIGSNGALFKARIVYRGSFTIKEYGFVWSEATEPTTDLSEKVHYSDNIKTDQFSSQIKTTLKQFKDYYVRSYLITDNYVVYGDEKKFLSLGSEAPSIVSITPNAGTWGDTIRITGKNFSIRNTSNKVFLGDLEVVPIFVSDSLLMIIIPEKINKWSVPLKVTLAGNTAIAVENFSYRLPSIDNIEPLSGTFNDTITLIGQNLSSKPNYINISIGGVAAKTVYVSPTIIKVAVPENLASRVNSINAKSMGLDVTCQGTFSLNAPIITSFEPETVTHPQEIITIRGMNFCPLINKNVVEIGGVTASITAIGKNYLMAKLPTEMIPYPSITTKKTTTVTISCAQQTSAAPNDLKIDWQSSWTRKADFPGVARHNAVGFALNGKGYYGTGLSKYSSTGLTDFWEYDSTTDKWVQMNNFPGNGRGLASSFVLNDEGYIGLGTDTTNKALRVFKDFYKYNQRTGSWNPVASFAGAGRCSAASFACNGIGYVTTGYQKQMDTWAYDPGTDQWSSAQSFPVVTDKAVGLNVGNVGYVYNYDKLYQYGNTGWTTVSSLYLFTKENIAFTIGNRVYIGFGIESQATGTNIIKEYNPSTGSSVVFQLPNFYRSGASVFVLNDKAYIVGGQTFYGNFQNLRDVWEFDPSKTDY